MDPDDMGATLDMIDYVYAQTERYDLGEESPLRNFVFQYVLCHIGKLAVDDRFHEVVTRNGNLRGDIMRHAFKP